MLASVPWYAAPGAFWAGAAGVILALSVGLLGVVATYRQRPARLVYELLSAEPLLLSSDSSASDLRISYRDQIIIDPQLLIVQIANEGGKDIPSHLFDKDRPVVLDLNVNIIAVLRNASALGSGHVGFDFEGSLVKMRPGVILRGDVIELVILASGYHPHLVLVDNPLVDVKVEVLRRRTTEPIRKPDYLRQYDELLPGAADRIMRMVEEQRRYKERAARVRLVTRLSAFFVLSLVLLVSIGASAYISTQGHSTTATVIIAISTVVAALGSVIALYRLRVATSHGKARGGLPDE